jgi:hypothetical protein
MDIETYQDNFKQLGCYQMSRVSRIPKKISAGEGEIAMVMLLEELSTWSYVTNAEIRSASG